MTVISFKDRKAKKDLEKEEVKIKQESGQYDFDEAAALVERKKTKLEKERLSENKSVLRSYRIKH